MRYKSCQIFTLTILFLTIISPNLQLKWLSTVPSSRRMFRHNSLRTEPPSSGNEHLRQRTTHHHHHPEGYKDRTLTQGDLGESLRPAASPESPAARLWAPTQLSQVADHWMSRLQDVRDHASHCRQTTGRISRGELVTWPPPSCSKRTFRHFFFYQFLMR